VSVVCVLGWLLWLLSLCVVLLLIVVLFLCEVFVVVCARLFS